MWNCLYWSAVLGNGDILQKLKWSDYSKGQKWTGCASGVKFLAKIEIKRNWIKFNLQKRIVGSTKLWGAVGGGYISLGT